MAKVTTFNIAEVQIMIGILSTLKPEKFDGRDGDAVKAVIYKAKSIVEDKGGNNMSIGAFDIIG